MSRAVRLCSDATSSDKNLQLTPYFRTNNNNNNDNNHSNDEPQTKYPRV